MARYWTPEQDGLTPQAFVAHVDVCGFTASAAALQRNICTVRRAFWRITEAWREAGGEFDAARGHHQPPEGSQ